MRTKQSALAAALGVALAAAVAACGSSSPQASAPAPASTTTSQSGGHSSSVSPTALLSLSDAANITGDSAITERNATSSAVTYSDHNTGDTVYIVVSRT
ncbi:MAG TPA: hypothetical protein VEJ87_16760, partial [Acidimicrobiales bacterium]|nr:hypothetical protein [Acidimicrobiales bacterium]